MKIITTLLCFFFYVCALSAQAPGTLDPTFGNGGKVVTSITSGQDQATSVVLQSDGKIVVAGYASSSITGKDFSVARYNTDGTLDNTFGTNGIVTTDVQLGSEDVAYSMALQLDGKLVLAGYSDDGTDKDAALVRYNTDGTLDNTFGTNGVVLTDFDNGQQDEIKVVKIHQLTGNIVVGGASIISSSLAKPVVARYSSAGVLDNTFNNTGIRLLWITSLDNQYLFSVEDLQVQPNGKISAVGWRDFPSFQADSDYWAGRINSDGSMDNTFSSDGVAIYNNNFNGHDRAFAVLLRSNNDMLVAGGSHVNTIFYDFSLFELSSTGSVNSGSGTVNFGSLLDDIAYGMAEDNNGQIVLAGSSGNSSTKTFAIARRNANFSADNNFGTNGSVTTTFNNNALNECFAVAIQTDNKIVAVGYTGNDIAIARYLGDGVPDLNNFQLISPANMAMGEEFTNLTFDWSDAYGAVSYELELDTLSTFNTAQTYTVSSSTYTAPSLMDNKTYYWRVRASDGTNFGAYSTTWEFTTKIDNISIIKTHLATLQLYPNPTTDQLVLEGNPLLINQPFQLHDLLGRNVLQGQITQTPMVLSLAELPTGVYWLQIGNQEQHTFKVVKK